MTARKSSGRDSGKKKIIPKTFYIASEGEKDEFDYFNNIHNVISKQFQHLIKVIPIERETGSAPKKVWNEFNQFIDKNKLNFNKNKDDLGYMVIDKDHHFQPNHVADSMQAVREAQKSGVTVLCSTPSFELWRLCHYMDITSKDEKFRSSALANKHHFLKKELAKVRNAEDIPTMLKKIKLAQQNEIKLNSLSIEDDPLIPSTLYSKVGAIVSKMDELGFKFSV